MAVEPTGTFLLGAATENGLSVYTDIDLDETKSQIKSTAGHLYSICAVNLHTAVIFLKIYFKESSEVTVGTTIPDMTIPLPSLGTANGSGVVWDNVYGITIPAATGITCACTLLLAVADVTSPGTSVCVVNIAYK